MIDGPAVLESPSPSDPFGSLGVTGLGYAIDRAVLFGETHFFSSFHNASISGSAVECQGEVGVASSMAAGALVAALGADAARIEKAAEVALEHHFGLISDPVSK